MNPCSYRISAPFRTTRPCLTPAKWIVDYVTPDDGTSMRKHAVAIRCSHHVDDRFFPKGTTGIVTSLLEGCIEEGCSMPNKPSESPFRAAIATPSSPPVAPPRADHEDTR